MPQNNNTFTDSGYTFTENAKRIERMPTNANICFECHTTPTHHHHPWQAFGLRDHRDRLRDHPDRVQGWESVCVDGGFKKLTDKANN